MRLGTFNVHGFRDATGKKRVDDVIALLARVACDVLVLNEVTSDEGPLPRIAGALGMHVTFGRAGWGANAVLTRAPPEAPAVFDLEAPSGELRSAVAARLALGAMPLDVVGLHLDHTREALRMTQLERLGAALGARLPDHVLAGDFNAMRLADLPRAAADRMHAARRKNGWEPAREDVVRALDAQGYVDAVRLAVAGSRAAYAAQLGAPVPAEHAVTSRVATRIDHVWLSPSLARRVTVTRAATVPTDVSDHALVWVELAGRAPDAG